jgi:outer membrane protein TolC
MMNMDKTLLSSPPRLIALAAAALLAGCALGPEYAGPPDAAPQRQQFVRAAISPMPPHRQPLVEGLNDANSASCSKPCKPIPTRRARARLQQSRANLDLEQANAAPSVGASALAAHARLPPANLGR